MSPARGASRIAACRSTVTSELYDGTPLNGVADLRAALLARSDVVVTHLTERLLSYALGRRVEHYDMPTVRKIVREAKASDYRMSALILGVVKKRGVSDGAGRQRRQRTEVGTKFETDRRTDKREGHVDVC